MNNKIKYITRSIRLAVYGAVAVSAGAMAQQAEAVTAEQDADGIEVIQVTSSRRVQQIQDVPAAVVAVNPEEYLQRGLVSLADVVASAPGFSFSSDTGQPGRGAISARGVSQQNDSAVTAIYLDDVPMTSNTGFAAGGRLFFDGLLGDVARVELIKGPQGTLFGATAIAGAVRYISNAPELEDARGKLTVDWSTVQSGGSNQLYKGFYSFPLIEGKAGLTLSAFRMDNGGYVDQVDGSGAVIREDANEADNKGYSADLLVRPTDELDIRIKAMKQESSFGLTSAVQIASLNRDELYGEYRSDNAFGSDKLTQNLVSASVSYKLDGVVLDFTSSKAKYTSNNAQDVVSLYGPLIELVAELPAGSVTSAPLTLDVSSEKTSHELRLTSDSEGKLEWLAGVFYTSEKTDNVQNLQGMPQQLLAVSASFPSDYTELAAYGNLTYYLTDNFDLTAGLRVSNTEQSLLFKQDGFLLGGASEEQMETADKTVETYLLTARYRMDKDTSFYSRIASGYRPAASNLSVQDPFTGELLSQPIVEQDDLWSYEVGVKGSALQDALSYESSLYYIDWSNFQTLVSFYGISTDGNAKNGITVKGWEGSVDYRLTRQFSMNASAAFARSTLNADEPELFGAKGATVPNVPKWTLNLGATYDYQLTANMPGWVNVSWRYKDAMATAFDDGNVENTAVNLESESISVLNLTTGADYRNWRFTLYINNLLNSGAYTNFNATVVPGTDIVSITGIPLEPRKIGLSVSYAF